MSQRLQTYRHNSNKRLQNLFDSVCDICDFCLHYYGCDRESYGHVFDNLCTALQQLYNGNSKTLKSGLLRLHRLSSTLTGILPGHVVLLHREKPKYAAEMTGAQRIHCHRLYQKQCMETALWNIGIFLFKVSTDDRLKMEAQTVYHRYTVYLQSHPQKYKTILSMEWLPLLRTAYKV